MSSSITARTFVERCLYLERVYDGRSLRNRAEILRDTEEAQRPDRFEEPAT